MDITTSILMDSYDPSSHTMAGYAEADEAFVEMEVPSTIKTLIRPAVSRSEEGTFTLTEDAWDALCAYLAILDKNY
jgi:hypothetical protein